MHHYFFADILVYAADVVLDVVEAVAVGVIGLSEEPG